MAKAENIPTPAVKRLSLYLRQLETFDAKDYKTVSSKQLGEALSLSDAQVRKDLAYFGQFGHPGVGYRVPELIQQVRRIMGTDKISKVLLVGAGNLGRALISFRGFTKRGFEIVAVFDNNPEKIGIDIGSVDRPLRIKPLDRMAEVARKSNIRMGVLCVPAQDAQAVAKSMGEAGIRGILNFAPVRLQVDPQITVSSVDLAIHLEQLSFFLNGPGQSA